MIKGERDDIGPDQFAELYGRWVRQPFWLVGRLPCLRNGQSFHPDVLFQSAGTIFEHWNNIGKKQQIVNRNAAAGAHALDRPAAVESNWKKKAESDGPVVAEKVSSPLMPVFLEKRLRFCLYCWSEDDNVNSL
jgi:hypothetical protein